MKRWIVVATVVWGLVIVGLGYYSLRHDRPTAREQTTIASALPNVDAALADVSATLDANTSVPVLGGYNRIGRSCSVTVAREGTRYERTLVVYTKEGTEAALLERVRSGLPERYRPGLSHNVLIADAGNFVSVRGGVTSPGQVRIAADTGCRPQDANVEEPAPSSATANRAPVQAVLDSLKVTASQWRTHRVVCPSGGALWTVEADTAGGSAPAALPASLRPGSGVVFDKPDLLAFRSGPAGVAVRVVDGVLVITSTTGCV